MSASVHVRDRELLRRTREGEAEAFGTFYRLRRSDVLAFVRVRVRSPELAAPGNDNRFIDVVLQARGAPQLPAAHVFPPAEVFHP